MFGIIGLGFAEVKYQAHGGDFAVAATQEDVSEVSGATSVMTDSAPAAAPENTAGTGLAQAAAKVAAAYTGKWDDDGDDHEDADENEDRESEDGDDDRGAVAVSQPAPSKPSHTATSATPAASGGSFTLAQIAAHNNAASCYTAINGNVYDLTSFISRHPGGAAAIKSLCGVDGTSAYNGQHGSSGRPANELASLKIGALVQ